MALHQPSFERRAFVHYLRTGRFLRREVVSVKFNPNHDPKNGQFTSGPGGAGSAAHELAMRNWPKSKVDAIPGYQQTGKNSWRAANDQVFVDAANAFNKAHNLDPKDKWSMTPLRLKAWAMVESGGDENAFMTDPFQVNNPGDWVSAKQSVAGLSGPDQDMTPSISARAALDWLYYKAHIHDASGNVVKTLDFGNALARYNAGSNPIAYANYVLSLEFDAMYARH